MLWTLIIVCAVAVLALAGWAMAELELRDAHRELDSLDRYQEWDDTPVGHVLHAIQGGKQ